MFKSTCQAIGRFLREEDGPTAVEYAVMIGMILAVCIVAVAYMADQTNRSFETSGDAIAGAFGN